MTKYPDVVNLQSVKLPSAIDPIHYIPHCCCSVIKWIKHSSTDPAWKRPRQAVQLDVRVSLSTDTTAYVLFVSHFV